MHIRKMTADDLDAVYEIECDAHISPWSRYIIAECLKSSYICLVTEKKHLIKAYSIIRIAACECHILNLCVSVDAQKQGLGRQLLEYIIDLAKKNCSQIFLEVRPSNLAAIALYQQYSFKKIGKRKDYYTNPDRSKEDALVLSKIL